MGGRGPRPFLSAMLIADQAVREERTGKVSLIGIFEEIRAVAFPCLHPSLSVYAKMTDAEGPYEFQLELIHLNKANRMSQWRISAEAPDRMSVGEMVVTLQNVTFPEPGRYEFRLLANDQYVGSKSFRVVQDQPSEGGERHGD